LIHDKGVAIDINESLTRIFGYTREEMIGQNIIELCVLREYHATIKENIAKRCAKPYQVMARKKDGTLFPIEIEAREVKVKDEEFRVTAIRDITERRRAEEELRDREEKLSTIIDHSREVYFIHDTEHQLTYVSSYCVKVFGHTPKQMMVKWTTLVTGNPINEKGFELTEKAIRTGERQKPYLLEVKRKDGELRWIELDESPVKDANGNVIAISGALRDVTERKRAREALLESEQNFRDMAENLSEGVAIVDENAYHIYTNPKFSEITGYSKDELLNMTGWDFTRPEDIAEFKQRMRDRMAGKARNIHYERIIIRKDGTEIPAEASTTTTTWQGKKRPMSIFRDITKRKQAEGKLRKSEERFRTIFETAEDSIFIKDCDFRYVQANPAMENLLGVPVSEIIGKTDDEFFGEEAGAHIREMDTRVLNGETLREEHTKPVNNVSFTFSTIKVPMRDTSGKIVGLCGIARDITEIKRLQALESRAERLETAGTIAGQVAHDFNNLLAPIMAYPEFIHDELPHDHKVHAYLDAIENAAEKIADINQDLLTMGRRGYYNQNVIDLNRVVIQAAQEMESRTKTVTIEMNLCEDLMKIEGGAAQIHRMLANLLVNARDAMQDIGQVTIKTENYYADDTSIAFGRVPKGEYVKLTVSDNGCGIPDDIIQKVLDPFFSTKTADKKHGSGLGLSVVDAVMKDHNGYLDLNSKVGHGTSFYLYFPVTRKDAGEDKSEHLTGGTETILIVDDDDIQREVSSQLLTKLGYRVSSVESGESAIEFLRENPRDLVILDMVMPGGIDGAETYRRILEISPRQKAIIVSGLSGSERVFDAQKLGTGAFVRKPVTKRAIAAAVRTTLDRQVDISAS
jgi:PAS domain S-box-containing protein